MTSAAKLPQQFNHSFDVDATTVMACTDGALFTGEPTAASALNIQFTGQVWNGTGTTLLATGDTHTFTAIGETYTFTVMGSFTVGSTILVQANNVPGTFPSTQGDAATATVADCSIAVPAMPGWGVTVLTLLLVAGGALLARRRAASLPRLAAFVALLAALTAAPAAAGVSMVPAFDKFFDLDTIGPGSTSMLTFVIDNTMLGTPADMLAFDDEFPAAVSFAEPAFVENGCGGTLTLDEDDADSAFDVRLTGGMVGAGSICTITVNVTSSTPGTHMNVSGTLTSSLPEDSGTAADDLTVDGSLPGFTKSFVPNPVEFGATSTLTFTIDNSGGAAILNLDFTDTLPPGMVVASPSNKATTCGTATIPATVTASPGGSTITLDANGTAGFPALAAGATCTVSVDVIGGAVGFLGNVSDNLLEEFEPVGKASAVLEVTGFASLLTISKKFTDDPVAPGGTVNLRFTITNKSRDDAATGITFDDTIDPIGGMAGPTGLTPIGLPASDVCGLGSTLSFGSGTLTLTGGNLPEEGSCTFNVAISVPPTFPPGSYGNTTTAVSGTVGGSPETGNVAGDVLSVVGFAVLTKEFTDDPVGAGGTVTLEFTIFNSNMASAMSGIAFIDELTDGSSAFPPDTTSGFLPFPVSVTLPPMPDPPCGGSSSLSLVFVDTDRQGLSLTGGSLAASDGVFGGMDTCTFSLTVDIPEGFAGGTYTNHTEEITATLDDVGGTPTVTGPPASGDIVVLGAPSLAKEFTDDPALPGGTATLVFTLEHDEFAGGAASAIAFTDDLSSLGVTIDSVVTDTCGGTPSGVGTDMFGYTGGSLATDATCTIELLLDVPSVPGGSFPNTTSPLTATVLGKTVTAPAASDTLVIAGLQFSKSFLGDPVIAGAPVTLEFTLDNTLGSMDATGIFFFDDLSAVIPPEPGLMATGPPTPPMPCGFTDAGSATFLLYSGGTVLAGTSCTFTVPLLVPATIDEDGGGPMPPFPTPDDSYPNVTSSLIATIGGGPVALPPAIDQLEVNSTLLTISKEFTDDPVPPGGTATLVFTIENLSMTETVTDIAFDDDLDAALSGLEATGAANTCGGMSPTAFPDSFFEFAGGTLLPGATCTVTVSVSVPAAPLASSPPFINTSGEVSGKVGTLDVGGGTATDELLVQLVSFTKEFTDDPAFPGEPVTLEFTITNLGADAVSNLSFTDDLSLVIPGLTATILPPVGICGPGSALSGSSFLAFTNGSLPAAPASCVITVTLSVPAGASAGTFVNKSSVLSSQGLELASAASDTLTIEPPPTFAKVFAPNPIVEGEVSTLTFTIDNSASTVAAMSLAFMDNLPAGVVVASPSNVTGNCGGTATAPSGGTSIDFSGGTVGAGASCTVSIDVTSAVAGMYTNTTGDLTSSSGNSGTASDTLTVNAAPPPTFTKVFSPNPVGDTFETTLTFTIDNSASALTANDLAFLDTLPFDLQVASVPMVANTCGGAVVAASESVSISLSGGSVAAGASCTISVKVFAPSVGTFENITDDLTSSLGNSGTATDTLTVGGCTAADGSNLTLGSDIVLVPETYEVCNTIEVQEHFQVLGPNGALTLRAGVAVILFNGVSVEQNGELTIEIDPSLIP